LIRAAARLASRAFWRFLEHHGPDRAAAVAYYTLLSLLPMLIFTASVGMKVFGSFDQAYRGTLYLFGGVVVQVDERTLASLRDFVERATRLQWPGILLLAWSAKRIFGSLFSALESVFGVPGRGFARHHLVALAMVLITGVGMLATVALTLLLASFEGLVLRLAGDSGARALHTLTALVFSEVLPIIITAAFFFIVYRVVPRRVVNTTDAAIGALLATVLWEAAKAAFAYYVRNLTHYAGVYGTLEGVIVLGLWLELSVSIILYCGEIVALRIAPERAPGS
jgi:membrane protein